MFGAFFLRTEIDAILPSVVCICPPPTTPSHPIPFHPSECAISLSPINVSGGSWCRFQLSLAGSLWRVSKEGRVAPEVVCCSIGTHTSSDILYLLHARLETTPSCQLSTSGVWEPCSISTFAAAKSNDHLGSFGGPCSLCISAAAAKSYVFTCTAALSL